MPVDVKPVSFYNHCSFASFSLRISGIYLLISYPNIIQTCYFHPSSFILSWWLVFLMKEASSFKFPKSLGPDGARLGWEPTSPGCPVSCLKPSQKSTSRMKDPLSAWPSVLPSGVVSISQSFMFLINVILIPVILLRRHQTSPTVTSVSVGGRALKVLRKAGVG